MRITSESAYNNLLRDLERISERMQKAQLEVSSGKKLHKASDNPAAMSDVIRIQADQSEIGQYLKSIATADSRLSYADTTLQGVETMVERIRTLSLLAMNNPVTANLHSTEVTGLRDQIIAAANTVFDGQFIFAGSEVDTAPYTKASNGTVTYNGNSQAVEVQIGRTTRIQIHLPGSQVFSGPIDIFATIQNVLNAMASGNTSQMAAEVANLEQFSTNLSGSLGKVGGLVNLARSVERDLKQYELARTAERSRLEDADLAFSLSELTQAETALRAATAVGARISNISILDYLS